MKSKALESAAASVPSDASTGRRDSIESRRRTVSDRFEELKEVEDGWFDGEGIALDPDGLDWLGLQMATHYVPTDTPLPHLFPHVRGSVSAEWSFPQIECGLEIDLKAHKGSWFDVDIETEEGIEERVLDIDSEAEWRWMTDRLASLVGKA